MDKKDLLELIASNKKFFVLVFCVIFGVISAESYNILKFPDRPKFRKIFPKLIVALFMCALCTPITDYLKIKSEYYPYCVLGISVISFPLLDWCINVLFPVLLSVLQTSATNLITKLIGTKNKKDDPK